MAGNFYCKQISSNRQNVSAQFVTKCVCELKVQLLCSYGRETNINVPHWETEKNILLRREKEIIFDPSASQKKPWTGNFNFLGNCLIHLRIFKSVYWIHNLEDLWFNYVFVEVHAKLVIQRLHEDARQRLVCSTMIKFTVMNYIKVSIYISTMKFMYMVIW